MRGEILSNRNAIDRNKTDFYPTPPEVTIALLNYLKLPINTVIWERACGEGHMAEIMGQMGYRVIPTDLYDRNYGTADKDYIGSSYIPCDWIITNPPFSLSVQFIERSIYHGRPFASLLKSQYWHSKSRTHLFNRFRPKAVLPLTWRPDFLFGSKKGAPTMECLWTVWDNKPSITTEYVS